MIYLDNAATTQPTAEVIDAMHWALTDGFANPSSRHQQGIAVREAVEAARRTLASCLRCAGDESSASVVFTSCGSEANNLAVLGLPLRSGTRRILCSMADHPSLLEPLRQRAGAVL
ncbi:MAG: aminotransferase class V-fold PLP-dependent enzyme, partial [Acidobacteria bacterium]|nr:aminotransferase class V-fold PLP-dependent enzyme [Acidobacteriota bacterium]